MTVTYAAHIFVEKNFLRSKDQLIRIRKSVEVLSAMLANVRQDRFICCLNSTISKVNYINMIIAEFSFKHSRSLSQSQVNKATGLVTLSTSAHNFMKLSILKGR